MHQRTQQEVQRDVDYINSLKKQNSDRQKEIFKLEKESQKAKERFNQEFAKLSKIKDKNPRNNIKYATVGNLNRILHYLEEQKDWVTREHISTNCGINKDCCEEGVNFLSKHKLIQEMYRNARYFKTNENPN
jgi:hypothetical protein